jgi:lantibiotic modifying enzyme
MIAFTEEELREIAARALFLKERPELARAGVVEIGDAPPEVRRELYTRWQKKAGGSGGEKAFLKRLALDGLSPEEAGRLLGPVRWKAEAPLPAWVRELGRIMSRLEERKSDPPPDELPGTWDLTAALQPFLDYAGERLAGSLGDRIRLFADSALRDVRRALARRLTRLCFRTCHARFQAAMNGKNPLYALLGPLLFRDETAAEWKAFLGGLRAGKWKDVLREHPVLARFMMMAVDRWTRNVAEFAGHLAEDMAKLEAAFNGGRPTGRLAAVDADVSDAHHGGKTVLILTFESGLKLVYKPRSLAIDAAWGEWIRWLERDGMPHRIRTPAVLDAGDHGWAEFMERRPLEREEDAAAFYFRAGVLLGSIYALGGSDFHFENLIACGAHPVPIDLETLLMHRVKPFDLTEDGKNAAHLAQDELNDSVLRVGMLPYWQVDAKGKAEEWGALTCREARGLHLPMLYGRPLDVRDYEEHLLAGFAWVYDRIAGRKRRFRGEGAGEASPLDAFGSCRLRFMIRGTQVYADVLNHAARPEFLRDGLLYSFEVERLAPAFLLWAPDGELRELWNVFCAERDALENRDIPIFYGKARGLALEDKTGVLHPGYFLESAIDRAKTLILRMDERDKNVQIDLIKAALFMGAEPSHAAGERTSGSAANGSPDNFRVPEAPAVPDAELLIEEAAAIFEEIAARRIVGADGEGTWIVSRFHLQAQKMAPGRIGWSFYDGLIGLGVFMAALYRLTGRERIRETALLTLNPVLKSLDCTDPPFPAQRFSLGLGSGLGGIIRGLAIMGEYLEAPSLTEAGWGLARRIPPEMVDGDRWLDVIGGSAGLILALLDLQRAGQDDGLLGLARRCGHHLLKSRVTAKSGHRVWASGIGKEPLTGMGHGAAGYAAALYRLARATREDAFREAALEAMDYENGLYDRERNNWPDLRKASARAAEGNPSFMAGWCSGAPGVGLARIAMLAAGGEAVEAGKAGSDGEAGAGGDKEYRRRMAQDVENAVEFARACPMEAHDHVCCGNAGRIDFLIEASLLLDRPDLLEEARRKAGAVIARKRRNGHYLLHAGEGRALSNPSFFQGIAGVGYTFLRCAAPGEIRSVLK